MKTTKHIWIKALLAITLLTGCGKREATYLPVKTDGQNLWSIVELPSKEMVATEEFGNMPSRIENGVFYVKNDEELYECYRMPDFKNPLRNGVFSQLMTFDEGVTFATRKGGPILLIDTEMNVVKQLPDEVETVWNFVDGRAVFITSDGKTGIMDTKGETIVPPHYDRIYGYEDGYTLAAKDGEPLRVLDRQGNVVREFGRETYNRVSHHPSEGYLAVASDGRMQLVDLKSGKLTANRLMKDTPDLERCYRVFDGVFVFANDGLYGLMDADGQVLIRAKYEEMERMEQNRYRVKRNGKCGIVDRQDNVICPLQHKSIQWLAKGIYLMDKDGRQGFLTDEKGQVLLAERLEVAERQTADSVNSEYVDVDKLVELIDCQTTADSFFGADCHSTAQTLLGTPSHLADNPEEYMNTGVVVKKQMLGSSKLTLFYEFDGSVVEYNLSANSDGDTYSLSNSHLQSLIAVCSMRTDRSGEVKERLAEKLEQKGFVGKEQRYVSPGGLSIRLRAAYRRLEIGCFFTPTTPAQ